MTDPRNNAPDCISALHGDARTRALAARYRTATDAYMRQYRNPAPRPSLVQRVLSGLLG